MERASSPSALGRSPSSNKLALSRSRSMERMALLASTHRPSDRSLNAPTLLASTASATSSRVSVGARSGVGEMLEARNREIQQMAAKLADSMNTISRLESEMATLGAKNKVLGRGRITSKIYFFSRNS